MKPQTFSQWLKKHAPNIGLNSQIGYQMRAAWDEAYRLRGEQDALIADEYVDNKWSSAPKAIAEDIRKL